MLLSHATIDAIKADCFQGMKPHDCRQVMVVHSLEIQADLHAKHPHGKGTAWNWMLFTELYEALTEVFAPFLIPVANMPWVDPQPDVL